METLEDSRGRRLEGEFPLEVLRVRNIFRGLGRNKLVVAGLAIVGASFAAKPAAAAPAGLGFYPATDIYGKGTFHYDADAFMSDDLENSVAISSGITYGIGPDTDKAFGRSEVGFDYNLTGGVSLDIGERLFLNAKTQLYNNDASGTRVVVGGWGLGDDDINPNYIYLLGSKTFEFGRVHVGVAHALSDWVGDDDTSLQLGFDRYLTPKLQFAIDYYTGDGPLSGLQPTLYYYINDKANFGLGYFLPNADGIDNQIYLCFDYNFDFNAK